MTNETLRRSRRMTTLLQIAGIYAGGRIITLVFLYLAAALAQPGSRFGPGLTIDRFLTAWDGQWYWTVAFSGYPTELALNDNGVVTENAWAFMPVYAWLSQFISTPFGLWGVGAAIVSIVSGFVASVALYRLLSRRIDHVAALWAVVFFANGPLGALFHIAYAEAMFIALLLIALDLVVTRRYGWLYVIIPVMGYTRPGVLAFSLMLALYGIWRWWRRNHDPLPVKDIVHICATGILAAVVGLSWQFIAAAVTGMSDAYLATELAWRRNWLPDSRDTFFPFDGWVLGLNFWFGQWQVPRVFGWTVFLAILAATIWMLVRSVLVRNLGMEIRLWSASYLLYLLAVFFPQSSTLRLLLPLTPLWGGVAQVKNPVVRIAVLIGCLFYQWIWIFNVFSDGTQITQIP